MTEPDNMGDRLRSLRDERSMTRHELADDSGVDVDLIEKLEHGRRQTARLTSLTRLADALGVGVSRLLGRRRPDEHSDRDDARNVGEAIVSADSMPGVDADDVGEKPDLAELDAAVDAAWRDCRSGDMSRLAGNLRA